MFFQTYEHLLTIGTGGPRADSPEGVVAEALDQQAVLAVVTGKPPPGRTAGSKY
jgi:hypothetical protein